MANKRKTPKRTFIGRKHGLLTIKSFAGLKKIDGLMQKTFNVECACGRTVTLSLIQFYRQFDCGVCQGDLVGLVGQTFGHLTVLRRNFSKKVDAWTCACDCGKQDFIATTGQLNSKNNRVTHCGCQLKNTIRMAGEEKLLLVPGETEYEKELRVRDKL